MSSSPYDIVVIGAGPAGLCFARALDGSGLRIALVEQQPEDALANPPDDGREIALTHRSQRWLREHGLWARIADTDIGTLRDAQVIDGDDASGLLFSHAESGQSQLGWLVSNHAIRRAAWDAVRECADVEVITAAKVAGVRADDAGAEVRLADGHLLHAQLLVAADSRFSESRRAMGIRADLHDFGKTMLVVRMRHEVPHDAVAWEWFRYGQTLALLPVHDAHASSAVLTATRGEIDDLLAQDADAFDAAMTERFDHRLGDMKRIGPAVAYPLVGVYPERFHATRFACIGDAAVGMHPVTAHGFNFGLLSVESLASRILDALAKGEAIWGPRLLASYDIEHRAATRPLYLATWLVSALYTDDRVPARALRKLALGIGRHARPFRRGVMHGLTQPGDGMPFERVRKLAMRLRPR